MSRIISVLGIGLMALVATGCDDDPAAGPEPISIAATAVATPDLSTLTTALQAAGLVGTLEGAGPFTVFAPSNGAFDALDAGVLGALLEDGNVDILERVLNFHVVAGAAVLSADLSDGQTVTTVDGGTLTIGVSGGSVTVNGANVVTADVEATNGVVHIIDGVLVPSDVDVYEKAVLTPATSTLASAILAAGLDDDLQATGPFTVFAPVDAAFEALGSYPVDALLDPDVVDVLSKILTFHVVSGDVRAGDLTDGGTATTLQGGTLTFDLSDASDPKVNGVSITTTDIEVGNGVIHLVDEVIVPPLTVVEQGLLDASTTTFAQTVHGLRTGECRILRRAGAGRESAARREPGAVGRRAPVSRDLGRHSCG
jgi:transforming growth factor-beta-induced protein